MCTHLERKVQALLVIAALGAFYALPQPALAQRMPEAAHGPSVASQAPLGRQAGRLCRLGDLRGLPSRRSPIVCEDSARSRGRGTADFSRHPHAGTVGFGGGGKEDL